MSYKFDNDLLEEVFEQAQEYILSPPGENEFIASDMAKKDPKGRSQKQWRGILDKMVEDEKLDKRWGRHPEYGMECWIYMGEVV